MEEHPIIPTGVPEDIEEDLASSIEDTTATRLQIAKALAARPTRFNPTTENLETELDELEKSFNTDNVVEEPISGGMCPTSTCRNT